MENGKWKTENGERVSADEKFSAASMSPFNQTVCPACGAQTERETAKFCRVCGKFLSEDYQPLDRLRASNRLRGKIFAAENAPPGETVDLFQTNKNSASESAMALVVYSLVPYLGIFFCPFAFACGVGGVLVAHRQPQLGGGRASIYSVVLAIFIFFFQIFLWWLFYVVPELGK